MKKKISLVVFIFLAFLGIASQEAMATCKKPDTKPVNSQIILTKKDSKTGQGLNNAYFSVSDKNGNVVFRMKTANSGGTISGGVISGQTPGKAFVQGDIQPGTYTLRETTAPSGYKLNETPQTFTISRGQTLELTMYNDPLITTGSLKINKVDADTGKALSGAEFSVTDKDGKVQTGVTNAAGVLELSNLGAGVATIKETKAPNGYVAANNIPSVTINVDKQSSITVKNQKEVLNGSLKIIKMDSSNGALLAGAEFSVTDAAGKTQTGVTNAAGILELSNLAAGVATIKETKAPANYVLDSKEIKTTISKQVQSSVTVKNSKVNRWLEIEAIDTKGRPVQGAEFIVRSNGKNFALGKTESDGIYGLNVPYGEGQVRHAKTPEGYTLKSSSQVSFITNNSITKVTFTYEKTGV